jgi:hypothetical protein
MFKIILAGLVFVFVLMAFGGAEPASTTTTSSPSEYGKCKADPTMRFQAGMYKEKYPSTSIDQILHILCKDK